MGNKPTETIKTGLSDQSQLIKEYTPSFQQLKSNPAFFTQLITENPLFANNLFQLFPDATTKFEAFFEMVLFLRREDSKFSVNPYAVANGPHSSLLDRFFMIVLKISNHEYQTKVMDIQQLDGLLINYFQLFLENPEKGSIEKILKFMKIEEQVIQLKMFASRFREYFPYAHKYLKDFYLLKFKQLAKDGHLLRQLTSKIISNDAVLLALQLPAIANPEIVELYSTDKHALGFHTIEEKLAGYTGPWLLLIRHYEKEEKAYYTFGSYQNGPIRSVLTYQGDVTGFMFSIHPTIKFFKTEQGEGGQHYFYINSIPEQKSKRRKGFGFGGDNEKKNFKLWIDEDLERSTVFNGKDQTYGFGSLASPNTERLAIKKMQVWGLGNRFNLEDQMQYRREREDEILRRRKVDKRQLVNQNAELFFQNTFAHREEVVGQIERRKEEK